MNVPKLWIMVGLSGSGKSSISKEIAKEFNCIIISSDEIRGEICDGGVSDQSKNEEVFQLFHKRIKDNLKMGKNVIADATNITMKSRRSIIGNLKNVQCYKIAYIVPKIYEECLKDNVKREYPVPESVLDKQLKRFQVPFLEEGFDEIYVHKFDKTLFNAFVVDCFTRMIGFDQKNPHHNADLYHHCKLTTDKFKYCGNYIYTEYILGAMLHDIGKVFTQTIDDNGIAHYYNHENVGSYYLLSWFESIKRYRDYDDEEILNILFLVNYHMMPMNWNDEATLKRWENRFGEYKYKMLLDFHRCDKMRNL